MKYRFFHLMMIVLAALLVFSPVYAKRGDDRKKDKFDDNSKGKSEHRNDDKGKSHKYEYRGKYKNFNNNNHHNRYYFGGKYYGFKEYYSHYSRDKAFFVYEGSYDRHGDIYIFTDAYGNEFDMYVKPVTNLPRGAKYVALSPGNPYRVKVAPIKWYPAKSERSSIQALSFSWGNLRIQNNKYFELHSSPHLISHNGILYLRN
jgi:hypothetical protein